MLIFWILVTGLIGLALLFVVLPLLRPTPAQQEPAQDALNLAVFKQRLQELDADLEAGYLDRTRYDAARHDLERDLLHDVDGKSQVRAHGASRLGRWTLALLLTAALPGSATLLYLQLGEPTLIERMELAARGLPATEQDTDQSMETLVQRLVERLEATPDDVDGWLMLGRTHFALERPAAGLEAVTKAYRLAPERIDVMLAYAEAIAANRPDRSLAGKPAELVQAVLERDPENINARWLTGLMAFQHGRFDVAAATWQQVLDTFEPGTQEAKDLQEMVDEAHRRADIAATSAAPASAADAPAPETATAPEAIGATHLEVRVSLDPTLAETVAPEDTVFVFARAPAGPAMPLAAQRLQVAALPVTLSLDDSMAMAPGMQLSAYPEIQVTARVSRSGEAAPQPGDLEGQSATIDTRETTTTAVVIDHPLP
ncbi:c-type cytochrome biogenesis protein CcmI [Marichromatium bheemlicum]|uniref:C-type cytochrome biogenesis protein CcmI n=1 Tax=Marichromatium bheemlicum TaxID=365339 RepID=A0ABX1I7H7_9GAMM|nr:c-type cytochrome biogenesis protein CcmI [Marichromatium bheemlicum]NKN33530.1 c-type cytochrome biogenesis protein CcmI [Marichromatium bheemlicum]